MVEVRFTTDPGEASEAAAPLVTEAPALHNVIATLLADRVADATEIRFWWARQGTQTLGAVFQSPDTYPATITRIEDAAVGPLAEALASTVPDLPGLTGDAPSVARLAGEYATVSRRPLRPVEGQRIYEVTEVTEPVGVGGFARLAESSDTDLVHVWTVGFHKETETPGRHADHRIRAEEKVASRRLWIWEHEGRPASTAIVSRAEGGVGRVGFVYTPDHLRGRGYASAVVAHVSRHVLADGHRCILYTQLQNPTSNGIYQKLGYRPVAEVIRYELEPLPVEMSLD